MHKDQPTLGTASLIGLWRMCVELEGQPLRSYYLPMTDDNLPSILKNLNLSREGDTYTMLAGPIKLTITATYYEQKKTPEKNGAT